ncbi:MAG: TAXI family TRAP transporter solute-binding subunit [Myxococcota bacterium]
MSRALCRLPLRLLLLLPLLLLLVMLWPGHASAEPPTLRWGAGSKKGGFTKISKALAEGLAQTGDRVRIEINTTKGSCDNIHRLLQDELDFALVQYDVAAEAFKASQVAHHALEEGEGAEQAAAEAGGFMCRISAADAEGSDLRLVSALTDGAVHVLVRRPLRLDSFTDLAKHRVYIGKLGSGSFETAKVIVGAAGLTVDELDRQDGGSSAAFEALRDERLRVMLRTTEPGHESIAKAVGSGVATVNELPEDVLNRLIDGYPYYRVCQIEANSYPGLDYAVPTVCVSTVLLTTMPVGEDTAEHAARMGQAVEALIDAMRWVERSPEHRGLNLRHRWHDFAEQEPIPLHPIAAAQEQQEQRADWLQTLAWVLGGALVVFLGRRLLKRRGLLKDPLESNLEGQLSNPLIPFAGFVGIVMTATLLVWSIEHDSNARVRTLNDSFWEMNMFATGNFDSESLKSSTARFIGATATIAGLGLLAWFTAALTNIFSRDQTRLFRRLRNHIVILNFREDMLQLIRMLRSPGPLRSRPIHVVVSDTLPRRVRLQLARVKGLTIHHQNPEVPEDLTGLRIPRAARVIVLQGGESAGGGVPRYHPLRIARAVHQACSKFEHHVGAQGPELGKTGFSVAPPLQHPALAGDDTSRAPSLPVTLAEANDEDPPEIFDPFRRWLIPVQGRELADSWMATASVDPGFAEIFNGAVSFRDDNSEVYTVPLPEWFHGRSWRIVRRTLYGMESRAGVIPLGLYRSSDAVHAYDAGSMGSSPQGELQKRLLVNPDLELNVEPGDRLVAFAEDEADLLRVVRKSRKMAGDVERGSAATHRA